MKKLVILLMFSISTLVFGEEVQDKPILIDFPNMNPVLLGQGWDVEGAEKTNSVCISFEPRSYDYNDKRFTYEKVVDNESLQRSLNISASASFKSITGSYSASTNLSQSTEFKSTSTYLAVFAEIVRGPEFVAPRTELADDKAKVLSESISNDVYITGGAVTLAKKYVELAQSNLSEFYRQCGTGFVATIQPGAVVNAVLEISGTSEEEKNSIAIAVSASGAGGSLSADLTQAMSKFQSNSRLNIRMTSTGGNDQTLATTLESLNAELIDLPKYAKISPRPLKMIVRSYSSLSNWPGGLQTTSLLPQEVIARAYARLRTILAYARAAANSDNGWLLTLDTDRASVKKLADKVQIDMVSLQNLAILCATDEKCDVKEWQNWSDFDLRMKLPFRGRYADLGLSPDASDLAEKLVDARLRQWVDEVSEFRCSKMGECLLYQDRDKLRSKLIEELNDRISKQ